MCDVCDRDIGHTEGCPLDRGYPSNIGCDDDRDITEALFCDVCEGEIGAGDAYIYDPDTGGIICSECIEDFSVSDILEVCGLSSVTEAIAEFSGKVMRNGDIY